MDPSGINSFEDQWRKALKEASEAPPPSVWEGIEARLDEENDKGIIPLWWQSPKIWYAAASVVALLLVGIGIWYSGTGLQDKRAVEQVAVNKTEKSETPSRNDSANQAVTEENKLKNE